MMHRGKIIEDFHDERKLRVRVPGLRATFDRVRKRELFDKSVAGILTEQCR
ncbi:MAG: hypothetical protein JW902_04125 [Syntrophaceae bacterium]|nr:hypothetical protein [Syntrophaceae bacterium]